MREIPLTHGKTAIVDDVDFERLGIHHWSCCKAGYAMRGFRDNGKMVYLKMHHAVIGKPPPGYVVDHINGNRLDNRRGNLRFVTFQQNSFNTRKHQVENVTSRFKGVSYMRDKHKWRSRIMIGGREKHIGLYGTEEEAALAYNEAAKSYFGEYAKLNEI
ncbi:MAG: hypothetical protein HFI10_11830 [Lachnospiraceae bacterium]|nr:hypothetical protein [Lachnospiraceae bacterium]